MSILDEFPVERIKNFEKRLQKIYDEIKEILIDEGKTLHALHCLFRTKFPRDKDTGKN